MKKMILSVMFLVATASVSFAQEFDEQMLSGNDCASCETLSRNCMRECGDTSLEPVDARACLSGCQMARRECEANCR